MWGRGVYYFRDGRVYAGEWRENRMEGLGKFQWLGSKTYIGYYKKDKKHGFGLYISDQSKKIFIGHWENGAQNGVGKFIYKNKQKYGIWRHGKRVRWINNNDKVYDLMEEKERKYIMYFEMDYEKVVEFVDKCEFFNINI